MQFYHNLFVSFPGPAQIEILDAAGARIRLAPSCIQLTAHPLQPLPSDDDTGNGSNGTTAAAVVAAPVAPRAQLQRLIGGATKTCADRHMWAVQFPVLANVPLRALDIDFVFPTTQAR